MMRHGRCNLQSKSRLSHISSQELDADGTPVHFSLLGQVQQTNTYWVATFPISIGSQFRISQAQDQAFRRGSFFKEL